MLAELGKIAGIGGISLGVLIIFIQALFKSLKIIPRGDRTKLVTQLTLGCFGVAIFGMAAWIIGSRPTSPIVQTHGSESPAVLSGGSVVINQGQSALPAEAAAQGNTPASLPAGTVETFGSSSPAVQSSGDVTIHVPVPSTSSSQGQSP